MAVYKVPQDVEADDKLIGPFSFRQFVFILVMIGSLYATYLFFTISPLLVIIPLPIAIFFGILGLWPRKDQPIEVYLAALLHFWTSPRKKIWDQEGHIEHVHINVPHKEVPHYTDGLQTYQVKSRLHNLAATLDSRGWTAKNLQGSQVPRYAQQAEDNTPSDRLIMPAIATNTPVIDDEATADVLDAESNPVGQNFQHMVDEGESQRQEVLRKQFQEAAAMSANGEELDDQQLNFNPYPDMHQSVVRPSSDQNTNQQSSNGATQEDNPSDVNDHSSKPSETAPTNAILNLANNSDLNVSTIARQAEQAEEAALHSGDTIELH